MGTDEKLTLENMGVAFGILSLGGTESEIHLGVIYPPPNCNVRFKKYHCNTRVKGRVIQVQLLMMMKRSQLKLILDLATLTGWKAELI